MTSKVLEHDTYALNTGEWWASRWWEDDQYYENGVFSKTIATTAILKLKDYFDATWFKKQRNTVIKEVEQFLKKGNGSQAKHHLERLQSASSPSKSYFICAHLGFRSEHPLFNTFLIEGSISLETLFTLSNDLDSLTNAGLLGDYPKRLKNDAKGFNGTQFELRIMAYLLNQGFTIRRNELSGVGNRNLDLRVEKDSEVLFCEVKNLDLSRTNKELSDLTKKIFFDTLFSNPTIQRASVYINIELLSELQTKATVKDNLYELQQLSKEITHLIIKDVEEKIKKEEWGTHTIPGIAKYSIFKKENGSSGSFTGFPYCQDAEVEKIFQKAVEEASSQLPKDKAGLLIIRVSFSVDYDTVAARLFDFMSENSSEYRHICAILLIKNSADWQIRYHVKPLYNHGAAQDISDFKALKDLLSLEVTGYS